MVDIEPIVYPIDIFLALRELVPPGDPTPLISRLTEMYSSMNSDRIEQMGSRVRGDLDRCFVGIEHERFSDDDLITKVSKVLNAVSKTADIAKYVSSIRDVNYTSDGTNAGIIPKMANKFQCISIDCLIFIDQFIRILKQLEDSELSREYIDAVENDTKNPRLFKDSADEASASKTVRWNKGCVSIIIHLFANGCIPRARVCELIGNVLEMPRTGETPTGVDVTPEKLRLEMSLAVLESIRDTKLAEEFNAEITQFSKIIEDCTVKPRYRIMIKGIFDELRASV